MDFDKTFVKQLFEDSEIEKLKSALARDKYILPAIIKLIEYRLAQTVRPTNLEELKSQTWAMERAFKDGKASELSWLHEFITKE